MRLGGAPGAPQKPEERVPVAAGKALCIWGNRATCRVPRQLVGKRWKEFWCVFVVHSAGFHGDMAITGCTVL